MNYKENSIRLDLVKYNEATKIISFRCSERWTKAGTPARELLLSVFVRLLQSEDVDDIEIEKCGFILGFGMKKK